MKVSAIKPALLALAATCLLGIGASAAPRKSDTAMTMNGEVVRRACVTGHARGDVDAKACTVTARGRYVFYAPATNRIYHLKDQKKAAQFAGLDVTAAGYQSAPNHKFHVGHIMPATLTAAQQ